MKRLFLLVTLIGFVSMLCLTGMVSGQDEELERTHQLGCSPDGTVFNKFVPDAVKLRELPFMTSFGTLNTIVVTGDKCSGVLTTGVAELSERIGELLTSVNSSALVTHLAFVDGDVPKKYLLEKTTLLVGGPKENRLVDTLVKEGKSKVDWDKAESGTVEIVQGAFGGPGDAVIAGGTDDKASYTAVAALAGFLAHLSGASLTEEGLLRTDYELQQGDVKGAVKSMEKLMDGLRQDGSTRIFIPVKNSPSDFPELLKDEERQARKVLDTLRNNPSAEQASAEFQKLAGLCAHCHAHYVSYDRKALNRVQFHYSQYPGTRCETDWAKKD